MLNIASLSEETKERYNKIVEKPEWKTYVLENFESFYFLIGFTYKFGSSKAIEALKGTKYGVLGEGRLCDLIYLLEYSLHQYGKPYTDEYFTKSAIASLSSLLDTLK